MHTWSLAVEEQFYLIWPAIILLIRKPKMLLAIVTALLLIVGLTRFIIWTYHIKELAYPSLYTFTRIDGICIGCMVVLLMKINPAFLRKYTMIIVLLMAAVNFGFYFINKQHSLTLPYLAFVGYTTFAVLFGLLIYEAVIGESKVIQFLFNNRILKFFGKISYGLYVFHWPIFFLLFPIFQKTFMINFDFTEGMANKLSSVIVTIIGILLSILSYKYFETYFLKIKSKYK
jgi:peptidoglycan/LPS O-acetylase OafA/YrhL